MNYVLVTHAHLYFNGHFLDKPSRAGYALESVSSHSYPEHPHKTGWSSS